MSIVCPSCSKETPAGFPRCANCGAELAPASGAREERKVVTCLFCDLVGFTARAESMDPEDVRRLLQPYHARVRTELERIGGTVEKFIGDAVMAVFGAPVAHEDDPERAVRAALSIREALAEEGELGVRIGITTGEALVALDARPDTGEGMASGDVVNTAARLQTAAPANGILVDETTYRATERVIGYGEAQVIEAKGKADPVPVWEALEAKARFGVGVRQLGATALVGRVDEMQALVAAVQRAPREREPQLVTLVGVPGIGKSRLVWELFQRVDAEPELTLWRQGRSLPYGEGVSFWALGEMVKAQAGILESDTPEQAAEKLREAVGRFVDDPADAAWIERHLRPLAGVEADGEPGSDRRDEAFAAWRRYLEAIADERPLVLVFEDLHWADDSLLDFVDYLVDWASGVPLVVLGTARPELLTRRPGWGGGKANSSTIQLSPLTEEETTALLHALLGRSELDPDVLRRLLEHAGGNPLYAEEFTRMFTSRPGEVVLPETVQGIIAARLDTLPPDEKQLLQDAAVVGRVFWLGSLGGERWTLEDRFHVLERKGFVSRQRRSTVAGEEEYAFRHALVHEVAYEQIPRAQRAGKHAAAAAWIESLGRLEDHAEMLAHHYLAALEYARDDRELVQRARRALRDAGDRAVSLGALAAAARYYGSALELWADDDAVRGQILLRYGKALGVSEGTGEDALVEARDTLLASGDAAGAADAEATLGEIAWEHGRRDRAAEHLERALALGRDLPSSAQRARVLTAAARFKVFNGEEHDAIRLGREALAIADELGLEELRAHALDNIGIARLELGDVHGLVDLERSVAAARAASSMEMMRACNNLGTSLHETGDLERALDLYAEALGAAERFGSRRWLRWMRAEIALIHTETGRWDEAIRLAGVVLEVSDSELLNPPEATAHLARAVIRLARGDAVEAAADARAVVAFAGGIDPSWRWHTEAVAAHILAAAGEGHEAEEVARRIDIRGHGLLWPLWPEAIVALSRRGRHAGLASVLRSAVTTPWTEAAALCAGGDFARAADVYAAFGATAAEAYARLRGAQKLAAAGRRAEANAHAEKALAFYRSVGATRYVLEAEALLRVPA